MSQGQKRKPAAARGRGRPREINRTDLGVTLCARISTGELVQAACADLGIPRDSPHRWASDDPDGFGTLYARARENQAHALAEKVIAIADGTDTTNEERLGAMVAALQGASENDKDRILRSLSSAAVQRDRIRVDAVKWLTSKIAPRLYGERIQQEVTGGDGGPLRVQVEFVREGRKKTAS